MSIQVHPMPLALPETLRDALMGVSFATIGHLLEEGFVDPAIRGLVVTHFYAGDFGRQVTGFPGPSVDRGGWRAAIVETFD